MEQMVALGGSPRPPLQGSLCSKPSVTHSQPQSPGGWGVIREEVSVLPCEELSTNMLPQPALVQASAPPLTVTLGKQVMLLYFPHLYNGHSHHSTILNGLDGRLKDNVCPGITVVAS